MKKITSFAFIGFLGIIASIFIAGCSTCRTQPEFPKITWQPEDQLVEWGKSATFSVRAKNGPLAYQWLKGGAAIAGQTNTSLTIEKAVYDDAGFYSCVVSKDMEKVPTRTATLMVFTNTIDPRTQADPVTVFMAPLTGNGSQGTCPGNYAGYVSYTKTVANGWGWAPATNTTIFTAADGGGRSDTKLCFQGKVSSTDIGCNQTIVTITNPPASTKYRFTIYFPSNVPTTNYPIILTGFLP